MRKPAVIALLTMMLTLAACADDLDEGGSTPVTTTPPTDQPASFVSDFGPPPDTTIPANDDVGTDSESIPDSEQLAPHGTDQTSQIADDSSPEPSDDTQPNPEPEDLPEPGSGLTFPKTPSTTWIVPPSSE